MKILFNMRRTRRNSRVGGAHGPARKPKLSPVDSSILRKLKQARSQQQRTEKRPAIKKIKLGRRKTYKYYPYLGEARRIYNSFFWLASINLGELSVVVEFLPLTIKGKTSIKVENIVTSNGSHKIEITSKTGLEKLKELLQELYHKNIYESELGSADSLEGW